MAEIMNYIISFLDHDMMPSVETHFVCTSSVHTCWIYFAELSIRLEILSGSLPSVLPSDTWTYKFIEPLTRLEIWFWYFSESRLEIIIKVRSGGFYLYFISLHRYAGWLAYL